MAGHLHIRRWCSIFVRADMVVCPVCFSHTFVGADAHIGPPPSIPEMSRIEIAPDCRFLSVVHLPEPKAIGIVAILRPKRAFRPRGAAKNSRAAARNITRLKRIFLPTFSGKTEKVGLRSNSHSVTAKKAVSVKSDKRDGQSRPPLQDMAQNAQPHPSAPENWNVLPVSTAGMSVTISSRFSAIFS